MAYYEKMPTNKFVTQPIEILNGNATITHIERRTTKHIYEITVKEPTTFRENTFYFPGWVLLVNNNPHPFTYKEHEGIINFSLPEGTHKVSLIFTNTNIVSFAQTVSLLTLIIMFFVSGYYLLKRGLRLLKKRVRQIEL